MNLYGANPDELDHLGTTLKRQIDSIQSVLSSVGGVLGGTTWMGPAHDRFQHDWDSVFTSTLHRLNEAFAAAGQDCLQRSTALRQVMGA